MIFPKAPDPKRLLEEQEAFQEAERRRAETRAQAIFDSLIDFSPVAIEIFDPQGNFLKSNRAAERLLGKIPPPGISLNDPRALKRTGLLEPQLRRLLAGARIETPPYWYEPAEIDLPPTPYGKVCLRVTALPLLDYEGKVKMLALIYENLTELKKAEASIQELKSASAISPAYSDSADSADARDIEFARRKIEQAWRESEERYRTLIDSAQELCIIRRAEDGRILAISPSVRELFGVSREAVLTDNMALYAQVHPEDQERVKSAELQARQTGEYPPGLEFRIIKEPEKDTVWLRMIARTCTFASRRTFEIIVLNITREKQLEELLRKKEQNIAAMLETRVAGVFLINRDWVITAWGKGAEKETRVNSEEAVGRKLWEVYPEAEASGLAAIVRKALLDQQPQSGEFFYQDGRERYAGWFQLILFPVDIGILGLITNITARRKIEQSWQELDRRFQTIWQNERILLAIKDANLKYIQANPVASATYGGGSSILGKSDAELFPATVTAMLNSQDRQVLQTGRPVNLELCLGDPKSATSTWVALSKLPLPGANGETVGVIDIGFDITRLVQVQTDLRRGREQLEKIIAEQTELLRRAREELGRWSG